MKSLADDSHVKTRICQYEALANGKGSEAAKQFVLGKLEGQNQLLRKHGLRSLDSFSYSQTIGALEEKDIRVLRNRLTSVEGKFSRQYFSQVLQLFSESFRPEHRRTFKAYDGLNNILNLAYRVLSWKVHIALIKAKLEPYLGFLHSLQWGTPSLVCDFQELYRYLIDDFVVEYCRGVKADDFVLKSEDYSPNRKGKRQYLSEAKNRDLIGRLNRYFETKVAIPRMRRGEHQEIETLIGEEALLFAKYLRDEKPTWNPRIVEFARAIVSPEIAPCRASPTVGKLEGTIEVVGYLTTHTLLMLLFPDHRSCALLATNLRLRARLLRRPQGSVGVGQLLVQF